MARTLSGTSPWPERKITGSSPGPPGSCCCTSVPDAPGIRRSRITQPAPSNGLPQALAERGERIPVILISASDADDTRASARRNGAAAFLRKPVDDQALVDAIEWVLGNAKVP